MYCKTNQKARVTYNFKNIPERTYETDKSPISVSGYYSPNNRQWNEGPVHDFRIFPTPDYSYGPNYEGISHWECGSFDFWRNPNSHDPDKLTGPGIDITTLIINPNVKCPKPLTVTERCYIEVKSGGIIIFQDQGECPVNFRVTCGDCPEGTIRCEQPGYPGYCCLPCQPIAQKINNLAARL